MKEKRGKGDASLFAIPGLRLYRSRVGQDRGDDNGFVTTIVVCVPSATLSRMGEGRGEGDPIAILCTAVDPSSGHAPPAHVRRRNPRAVESPSP